MASASSFSRRAFSSSRAFSRFASLTSGPRPYLYASSLVPGWAHSLLPLGSEELDVVVLSFPNAMNPKRRTQTIGSAVA